VRIVDVLQAKEQGQRRGSGQKNHALIAVLERGNNSNRPLASAMLSTAKYWPIFAAAQGQFHQLLLVTKDESSQIDGSR